MKRDDELEWLFALRNMWIGACRALRWMAMFYLITIVMYRLLGWHMAPTNWNILP